MSWQLPQQVGGRRLRAKLRHQLLDLILGSTQESLAFLPDIVVIGSWGRHDWGKAKAATEIWDIASFQRDYDDLVQRYLSLPSHPKIFASLPVPIPYGTDGPDNGVFTSAVVAVVRMVADKYSLPIVDLHAPFLGHRELYKQPPDNEGEGEHVTDAGLRLIANAVQAAIAGSMKAGGCGCRLGSDGPAQTFCGLAALGLLAGLSARRRRR